VSSLLLTAITYLHFTCLTS